MISNKKMVEKVSGNGLMIVNKQSNFGAMKLPQKASCTVVQLSQSVYRYFIAGKH